MTDKEFKKLSKKEKQEVFDWYTENVWKPQQEEWRKNHPRPEHPQYKELCDELKARAKAERTRA